LPVIQFSAVVWCSCGGLAAKRSPTTTERHELKNSQTITYFKK